VEADSRLTQNIIEPSELENNKHYKPSRLGDDKCYELVRLINSGMTRANANLRVGLHKNNTVNPFKEKIVDYHVEFCSSCKAPMMFGIINKNAMPKKESHWLPFRRCAECACKDFTKTLK